MSAIILSGEPKDFSTAGDNHYASGHLQNIYAVNKLRLLPGPVEVLTAPDKTNSWQADLVFLPEGTRIEINLGISCTFTIKNSNEIFYLKSISGFRLRVFYLDDNSQIQYVDTPEIPFSHQTTIEKEGFSIVVEPYPGYTVPGAAPVPFKSMLVTLPDDSQDDTVRQSSLIDPANFHPNFEEFFPFDSKTLNKGDLFDWPIGTTHDVLHEHLSWEYREWPNPNGNLFRMYKPAIEWPEKDHFSVMTAFSLVASNNDSAFISIDKNQSPDYSIVIYHFDKEARCIGSFQATYVSSHDQWANEVGQACGLVKEIDSIAGPALAIGLPALAPEIGIVAALVGFAATAVEDITKFIVAMGHTGGITCLADEAATYSSLIPYAINKALGKISEDDMVMREFLSHYNRNLLFKFNSFPITKHPIAIASPQYAITNEGAASQYLSGSVFEGERNGPFLMGYNTSPGQKYMNAVEIDTSWTGFEQDQIGRDFKVYRFENFFLSGENAQKSIFSQEVSAWLRKIRIHNIDQKPVTGGWFSRNYPSYYKDYFLYPVDGDSVQVRPYEVDGEKKNENGELDEFDIKEEESYSYRLYKPEGVALNGLLHLTAKIDHCYDGAADDFASLRMTIDPWTGMIDIPSPVISYSDNKSMLKIFESLMVNAALTVFSIGYAKLIPANKFLGGIALEEVEWKSLAVAVKTGVKQILNTPFKMINKSIVDGQEGGQAKSGPQTMETGAIGAKILDHFNDSAFLEQLIQAEKQVPLDRSSRPGFPWFVTAVQMELALEAANLIEDIHQGDPFHELSSYDQQLVDTWCPNNQFVTNHLRTSPPYSSIKYESLFLDDPTQQSLSGLAGVAGYYLVADPKDIPDETTLANMVPGTELFRQYEKKIARITLNPDFSFTVGEREACYLGDAFLMVSDEIWTYRKVLITHDDTHNRYVLQWPGQNEMRSDTGLAGSEETWIQIGSGAFTHEEFVRFFAEHENLKNMENKLQAFQKKQEQAGIERIDRLPDSAQQYLKDNQINRQTANLLIANEFHPATSFSLDEIRNLYNGELNIPAFFDFFGYYGNPEIDPRTEKMTYDHDIMLYTDGEDLKARFNFDIKYDSIGNIIDLMEEGNTLEAFWDRIPGHSRSKMLRQKDGIRLMQSKKKDKNDFWPEFQLDLFYDDHNSVYEPRLVLTYRPFDRDGSPLGKTDLYHFGKTGEWKIPLRDLPAFINNWKISQANVRTLSLDDLRNHNKLNIPSDLDFIGSYKHSSILGGNTLSPAFPLRGSDIFLDFDGENISVNYKFQIHPYEAYNNTIVEKEVLLSLSELKNSKYIILEDSQSDTPDGSQLTRKLVFSFTNENEPMLSFVAKKDNHSVYIYFSKSDEWRIPEWSVDAFVKKYEKIEKDISG